MDVAESRVVSFLISRTWLLLCALLVSGFLPASSQIQAGYLLRLAHESSEGNACVLLQVDGAFHYENGDRYNTRTYEGTMAPSQLSEVVGYLEGVSRISQKEIEEPLIHGAYDIVDISFVEDGAWRGLLFRTSESQATYKKTLHPLLHWMDTLHKLPHRELSEDAGTRNCLPRRNLRLIPRAELSEAPPPSKPSPKFGSGNPALISKAAPTIITPLLQFGWIERTAAGAHQSCAVIASNGDFRFEARVQNTGSQNLKTTIARGQLAENDLRSLRSLLDAPPLNKLRHHEPPGGMPLNIMGSVLELYIARQTGVQELVLTDSTRRSTFFYRGDGDVSYASSLLKFVKEQLQSKAVPATNADRNGCTELP